MDQNIINKETAFHDKWAESVDPSKVKVKALKEACTLPETRYILAFLERYGGVKEKKILEVGCGCGEASVYFATQGAEVIATDISGGMVELAKNVARYHNVEITGITCSADMLPFDEESFDIVYAANVLHHVDMYIALDEIKRVLKPGGYLICWDPIKYNPVINLYRHLASGVRSIDEHPIGRKYLKAIEKRFSRCLSKGFWLNTCLIFIKYYLIDKVDPSKERYWKKIIDDAEQLKPIYTKLENIDKIVLKIFPFLKWMCWNLVVIAKKERLKNV